MKIKITPLNDNLKFPKRAHYNDAGADVFSPTFVQIPPNSTIKVPLGFSLEIPDGFMGCIYPKSSLSSMGIIAQIPPIDSGYRGEIHVILTNNNNEDFIFIKGEKLGQIIITPVILADFVTELYNSRGSGSFGSTGVS